MDHRLRVTEVIAETADACSLVLAVPPELAETFAYRPGQYVTVLVEGVARCYSLASSPHTDKDLKITIKRVRDGQASNWICDHVRPGAMLDLLPPAGEFVPASLDDDLLLLAGGSGITPVMAIVKSVLAHGRGRLTLVYANRDTASIIFAAELADLVARHGERLTVTHWLDSERGAPTPAALAALVTGERDRTAYVCGPDPFVAIARDALHRAGVPRDRVRIERFALDQVRTVDATLEVELDGRTHRLPWPTGKRMLDVVIEAGLNPPFSCRQGHCGACACRLLSGKVEMIDNQILEEEDFAEGYVLACQSVARSETVSVTYY
ncbi:3-ketosteroid-9-alpha-monooxygenase, ferredoxin reductase component [Actinoplanes ianthinogenes]|uniref:3-ketosteroid-9-alpha-hydroxylase reductase subunit n=1 Tax=Actinoplanes ianthinogenes TaxID=122358 RepID=A0ABM7LPR0_9ACTN|nr:ferredoxin--NADP reductase [Actinoplanes ianthinogenes]BCJ41235.1 3-ketosteroid-9-alpha-hydroxylase reductase subunit [Actinoplanes ianthinogenes]GGR22006.1 3-ketosteroid-9-alpha-monooxygenase, ferredoxin reductase component [Actinoplanes ianthinogenes]